MSRAALGALLLVAIAGCRTPEKIASDPATNAPPADAPSPPPQRTHLEVLLDAVQSDDIQFVTFRPPGSPFISLGRRMAVVAPPDAIELSHTGDVRVLEALLPLLLDERRAYGAEVVLRAMLGDEPLGLPGPAEWWRVYGPTAHDRWTRRLAELHDVLVWNAAEQHFDRKR